MLAAPAVIIILTISIISVFVVHAILGRCLRKHSGQIVALLSVVAGYIPLSVLAVICIRQGAGVVMVWVYLLLAHTLLGYTYFHFYNTSETARRIRLLHEIDLAGGVTADKITELYRTEDILELRLQRLVQLGQLHYVNGRYLIKNNTLYVAARIMEEWQRLLGFRRSEG